MKQKIILKVRKSKIETFDKTKFVKNILYYGISMFFLGPLSKIFLECYASYLIKRKKKRIIEVIKKLKTMDQKVSKGKRIFYWLKDFLFLLCNWFLGISVWHELISYFYFNSAGFPMQKLLFSVLIILFYAFVDAIYMEDSFFKKRRVLLQNPIIRKKFEKLYPGYSFSEILKEL